MYVLLKKMAKGHCPLTELSLGGIGGWADRVKVESSGTASPVREGQASDPC